MIRAAGDGWVARQGVSREDVGGHAGTRQRLR